MPRQSEAQKETVERVMHEFKHGELKTGAGKGPKVKNPKQAIAIALHEAGASDEQSDSENRRSLKRTKAKERKGETARDRAEGGGPSKANLYAKARQKGIEGRSKMSKAELERAIGR